MRTPRIGKPRAASRPVSLSSRLPRLSLPTTPAGAQRPRPQVGRPGKNLANVLSLKR